MIPLETLASASPTLLYLGATVYLFLRLEKANKQHTEKMEKLVERYHSALLEGLYVFKDIEKHMEEER